MTLHNYQAVANGLGTDHPIPGLPFVDDGHLPLDDRDAIEAIGRGREGMGGRTDQIRPDGGWVAYTTDPQRHDLGWVVRWHPEHGRSVVLYRDEDVAGAYMTFWGPALLFRSGGYWWDGTTWYRPSQIFDRASETYVRRPVPAATTMHVSDLLGADADDTGAGTVVDIKDLTVEALPAANQWRQALAGWAARRRADALPLQRCVVQVNAMELAADQLISTAQLAEVAGIGESTLRAYLARGENSIPAPQATVGGRSVWALPVAEEWAERRRNSPEGAAETMAAPDSDLPVGVSELWQRFTKFFVMDLWEHPDRRKRWALRWRTEPAVRDTARGLAWTVAASLDRIVPTGSLAQTVYYAVLDEINTGLDLEKKPVSDMAEYNFFGIQHDVAKMLDWLRRHDPGRAYATISQITGEAERRWKIPRPVLENTFRKALALDGQGDEQQRQKFLDRVFPPR